MKKNTHKSISRRDFLKLNLIVFAIGLLDVPFQITSKERMIALRWKTKNGEENILRYRGVNEGAAGT